MAKGVHGRSGPPPDPHALRRERDSQGEWTVLPPSGRGGDPPDWPLSSQSDREAQLWESEWRRPQAVMWERNKQALEVALFVRAVVDAENPRATVAARTLVRQQMEALGISVPGLLRNRWRIVDETETAQPEQKPRRVQRATKDRLKVVQGGQAS